MAEAKPKKYKKVKVSPCNEKSPKTLCCGIINEIIIRYTGKRAEQVVNGVTKMVINRSFQFSMFRVAIMAGIAQAVPEIKGTTLLPLNPNRRMTRSIKKTTRLIYPVSSSMAINKNRKAICGIKMTIPPKPGKTPSARRLVKSPAGKFCLTHSPIWANVWSIKSIG